jgi:hypothetical protein
VGHDEPRPCIHRLPYRRRRQNCPGSDDHPVAELLKAPQSSPGRQRCSGDFDDVDSPALDGLSDLDG